MSNRIIMCLFLLLVSGHFFAQESVSSISGAVKDIDNQPVTGAVIFLDKIDLTITTKPDGTFAFKSVPYGDYTITVSSLGYKNNSVSVSVRQKKPEYVNIILQSKTISLQEVEVFGVRGKQPEGLEFITRMPLLPKEQIQTISVISDKLIKQQDNQTLIEATRNVPGVYTYATYGNTSQSISSRGFRGIPIYKNGVRLHSDQRGYGFINDMQSVESIQVLKGSSAVTMGAATDLGSPGGIINVVSKTPHFENKGEVAFRIGSFGQYRPTFDVQQVLNRNTAIRVNGGYDNSRDYRRIQNIGIEKFFINPSLAWQPDSKTSIILELDYLDDSRTADVGTVNLDPTNETNRIYEMPKDKFLGFDTDRQFVKTLSYGVRIKRDLTDKLYLRAAFVTNKLDVSGVASQLSPVRDHPDNRDTNNIFARAIGSSGERTEKNNTIQLDLIGKDLATGVLKHTFMIGMDYSRLNMSAKSAPRRGPGASIAIDTIDIRKPVSNKLALPGRTSPNFTLDLLSNRTTRNFGIIVQDVISLTDWAKIYGALRLTRVESTSEATTGANDYRSTFINPLAGFMISATRNINIFGSYTNNTHSAWEFGRNGLDKDGNELDDEHSNQFEVGIKSEWFDHRLRFNVTGYLISNKNMIMQAVERNPETGFLEYKDYNIQGGNDERKGIEVELSGRILENLEIITGYAYIDAKYKESTTFVENSSPNNTPKHTFNAWANYIVDSGSLKGLSIGAGVYHLGKRPYNDWTKEGSDFHDIQPMLKPWYNKAYTIVNAQLAYPVKDKWNLQLLFNNIFDAKGYDAYRTVNIDRITPFNFAGIVTYKF